jgi:glycosyltransferase involved in cell wall biosynthesis
MNNNPLITVIIPLFNSGKGLINTLDTVVMQTYQPIEVLLIDDGSTDNTPHLAVEFANAHGNVIYYCKKNGGVGAARNYGISKAKGSYIALCDHDDLWCKSKLEKQIKLFSSPSVGLVYTGAYYVETADIYDMPSLFAPQFYKDKTYFEGRIYYDLLKYNCICASSALFSRVALDQVGGFDESWAMHGVDDRHMWLRIAHNFEVRAVREILVRWGISERNWSKNEVNMMHSALTCLNDITSRFPETTKNGTNTVNKAYSLTYQHFGQNLFNCKNYFLARKCYRNVLSRNLLNLTAFVYYLCTFLPPVIIDSLRKYKRLFFKPGDSWGEYQE